MDLLAGPVTQPVQRQDGAEHHDRRHEHEVWVGLQLELAVGDHRAPTRFRRRHSEAEVGQRPFGHDDDSSADEAIGQDRQYRVGEDLGGRSRAGVMRPSHWPPIRIRAATARSSALASIGCRSVPTRWQGRWRSTRAGSEHRDDREQQNECRERQGGRREDVDDCVGGTAE